MYTCNLWAELSRQTPQASLRLPREDLLGPKALQSGLAPARQLALGGWAAGLGAPAQPCPAGLGGQDELPASLGVLSGLLPGLREKGLREHLSSYSVVPVSSKGSSRGHTCSWQGRAGQGLSPQSNRRPQMDTSEPHVRPQGSCEASAQRSEGSVPVPRPRGDQILSLLPPREECQQRELSAQKPEEATWPGHRKVGGKEAEREQGPPGHL